MGIDRGGGQVHRGAARRGSWRRAAPECAAALDETLYTAAEALRVVTALLYPVMPESAAKIWLQLGIPAHLDSDARGGSALGTLAAGQKLRQRWSGVFPRAEAKASIEKMKELEAEELARQMALLGKIRRSPAQAPVAAAEGAPRSPSTISRRWTCAWAREVGGAGEGMRTSCCT